MGASLHGIPEFVAVADGGGFSAAGRRLGLSKSLVSERVAALEARLGTRLLARTTRRVALTEAGAAFLERARRVLEEAEAAEAAVQALHGEPRGRLRVATTVGLAADELAPLLPAFHARHPEVEVELLADDRVVDLVAERIDVALRAVLPANPAQVARRLAPIRYAMAAAPAYLARHGHPVHPAELAGHACVLYGPGSPWDELRFRRGAEEVGVRLSGFLRTQAPLVAGAAIAAGCGIGLVMSLGVPCAVQAGALVTLFPDWRLVGYEGRDLWAVYPDNRHIPPKVRAFIEFLAAQDRFGGAGAGS